MKISRRSITVCMFLDLCFSGLDLMICNSRVSLLACQGMVEQSREADTPTPETEIEPSPAPEAAGAEPDITQISDQEGSESSTDDAFAIREAHPDRNYDAIWGRFTLHRPEEMTRQYKDSLNVGVE